MQLHLDLKRLYSVAAQTSHKSICPRPLLERWHPFSSKVRIGMLAGAPKSISFLIYSEQMRCQGFMMLRSRSSILPKAGTLVWSTCRVVMHLALHLALHPSPADDLKAADERPSQRWFGCSQPLHDCSSIQKRLDAAGNLGLAASCMVVPRCREAQG